MIAAWARRANLPGDLTLSFLKDLADGAAERFLVGLPGIGPKSARCVLSYSLDRAVFAVDTHVHRIFRRLGVVPSAGRKADHDPFQDAVPGRGGSGSTSTSSITGARCAGHRSSVAASASLSRSAGAGGNRFPPRARFPVAVDLFACAGGLGSGFRPRGIEWRSLSRPSGTRHRPTG